MKKRSLRILLILLAFLFIIKTMCIAAGQDNDFEDVMNQTQEESMEVTTNVSLSTTQVTNTTSLFKEATTTTKNLQTTQTTKNTEIQTTFSKITYIETEEETSANIIATEETAFTPETSTDYIVNDDTQTEEVLTTYLETQEEKNTQTNESIEKTNDCIVIKDTVIPIAYGPATQEMVDENDVVQDTELLSDSRNKYFFGHYTRSFSCLHNVEIGDIITVINNGIKTNYRVFRNERGKLTEDGCNIKSLKDDTYLILTDYECETIRLITCYSLNPGRYRIVVIGEKIE